jgi:hypothetical protein
MDAVSWEDGESSSQEERSGVVSFRTSTTNAYSTPVILSSRPCGMRDSSSSLGSGGETYSNSASLGVFGTLVTRRCSAQRSEKSRPRAGRAVVAAKMEMGFVGRRDAEGREAPLEDPRAGGYVRVFRRMVRMLWVWERVWRVREKVERRVCAVVGGKRLADVLCERIEMDGWDVPEDLSRREKSSAVGVVMLSMIMISVLSIFSGGLDLRVGSSSSCNERGASALSGTTFVLPL